MNIRYSRSTCYWQTARCLSGRFIIAGYFNQANLKVVFPKFYDHVSQKDESHSIMFTVRSTLPHLVWDDHISLFLIPSYRPFINFVSFTQLLVCVFPNNKTWMTKKVQLLLKVHKKALHSCDELYSLASSNLIQSIRGAKASYKQRIDNNFDKSDPQSSTCHGEGRPETLKTTFPAIATAMHTINRVIQTF